MSAPVYVILGGSGGIGAPLVRRLASDGARVVVGARDAAKLSALAADTGAEAFSLDATDGEAVDALVAGARERHGRVDGVANLVGSITLKPLAALSPDEFDETLRLNLHTAFHAVRAAAKHALRNPPLDGHPPGASVVLMASVAAGLGLANHEAIAAAKAGVEGLARAAAASFAGRGLRVNCVAPGLVRTPLAARLVATDAAVEASAKLHPLGRIGEPDDLTDALALLLDGRRSGWITGQTIAVDGGMSTLRPR